MLLCIVRYIEQSREFRETLTVLVYTKIKDNLEPSFNHIANMVIEGATTIPKGSRIQADSKRETSLKYIEELKWQRN